MPRPIWYKVNVQLLDVCSWGWLLRQRGGVWLHVQWQMIPLDEATKRGHAGVMKLLQKTPGTRDNSEL
jgi:hypothetical protein